MEKEKLSAKKRDRKIFITDIAIQKIPRLEYRGLTKKENDVLYHVARRVLLIAQDENESNEVAITCDLSKDSPLEELGISYGEEHNVDVCADTASNHIIVSAKSCAVVIMHNHPTTQTLSVEDIRFFLHYSSVRIIAVVTNQGNIHYLCKDKDYCYENAKKIYDECVESLNHKSQLKDFYLAGLSFLARCSEAGLFYS